MIKLKCGIKRFKLLGMVGISFLTYLSLPAYSQIRYEAKWGANNNVYWTTKSSKISCILSYSIPNYGRGDFVMFSGSEKRLSFQLFPLIDIDAPSMMRLISSSPEWKAKAQEDELGSIKLYPGFNPFVGQTVSWRMLSALRNGNKIYMPYQDPIREPERTIIPSMSPLGFDKPYSEFINCQTGLLNVGYNDVKILVLQFDNFKSTLTLNSLNNVKKQIEYILNDPSVNKININVYTYGLKEDGDTLKLANSRVDELKKIFLDAGIDKSLINTQIYGNDELNENFSTTNEPNSSGKAIIQLQRDIYKINRDFEYRAPDVGYKVQ